MKQVYSVVLAVLLLANAIQAEPMPIELRVNISNDRDLVRRQALGGKFKQMWLCRFLSLAPFYGPAGGCCPGCPCCPGCMAAPPPVPPPVPAYAPPPLAPLPVPGQFFRKLVSLTLIHFSSDSGLRSLWTCLRATSRPSVGSFASATYSSCSRSW